MKEHIVFMLWAGTVCAVKQKEERGIKTERTSRH